VTLNLQEHLVGAKHLPEVKLSRIHVMFGKVDIDLLLFRFPGYGKDQFVSSSSSILTGTSTAGTGLLLLLLHFPLILPNTQWWTHLYLMVDTPSVLSRHSLMISAPTD
jgi:hypothetical protein